MDPGGAQRPAPSARAAATQGGAAQDLGGARPGRAAARLGRALLLVALAWLVSVGATWIYVQQRVEASYERSLRRVESETRDLSALLHAQIVESLTAAADLTRVLASGARTGPGPVRALLENLRSDRVSYRRVSLTDARGVVIASTDPARVGTSLSRRAEFERARAERGGAALIVGKPLAAGKGRSSSIPLLRRVAGPDGAFDGVVEVLIAADHLVRQFDAIDLGELGMVALVDLDGAAYARSDGARSTDRPDGPAEASIVAAVLERARILAWGTFGQAGDAQPVGYVVSYRSIERHGLIVLVAKSADEFLDQHALFRRDWISTGAVITALVSLVGLLSLIYLRHERRSAKALAQAFAREHANARTDPLTGLPNRRAFLDLLAAQIEYHRRRDEPLSIAYFDCDRFKQVNDRLGHEAGDRCLLLVGTALSEGLRRSDYPCRIGGDEFAALFPSTASGDAALVMERLRARLARTLASAGFPVTVSVGVIEVIDFDAGPEALLTEVDSVMYQAKRTGGNRVVAMPSAKRRGAAPA